MNALSLNPGIEFNIRQVKSDVYCLSLELLPGRAKPSNILRLVMYSG